MTLPARRPRFAFPLAAGGILLILAGCTIGMDDRPVPPALIPMAADGGGTATYGAPAQDYSPIAAAPAVASAQLEAPDAFPAAPGGNMVWQTGPQPVAGASEPAGAESTSAEEPISREPVEAEAETASADESDTAEPVAAAPESVAASHAGGFRLAPFVGIDAGGGKPLMRALMVQAEVRGVALDGGADAMVLKTYLSSYAEGGETVLTWVFDVYAPDGTRLTRIDGQERVPGGDWADAPPELVKAVAKKAMRRLEAWQAGAEA